MDRIVRVYGWVSNTGSTTVTTTTTTQSNAGKDLKTPTGSSLNYPFQENGKLVLEHSWEMPDLVMKNDHKNIKIEII
jgi:hypothetical protein